MARKAQGSIDLLFLGDSITDNWPEHGADTWDKFAPYRPANFAVTGISTEGILWNITNGELDGLSPKVAVIMIGTNNIGQNGSEKPAWAAAAIKKIVETVREKMPHTKVLLLAVFPRNKPSDGRCQRVDAINPIIRALDDGQTVRYLDIGHVFLQPDGAVSNKAMPDYLPPNAYGYQLCYDAMIPLLSEMMK